jgi:uncharacterized membrane protein YeaQ/YmgE (transglycosylase-associated protein family)
MNIVMWILAGGILGWAGFSFLNFNHWRGLSVSIIIGAGGGFLGGQFIAPMFSAAAALPGAFSAPALLFAAAVAAAALAAGNLIHDRWGV